MVRLTPIYGVLLTGGPGIFSTRIAVFEAEGTTAVRVGVVDILNY